MPVFWFALLSVDEINWLHSALLFFIIHLLVYPASNAYNSYMDRDTESIGGVIKPMEPTRQLFIVSVVMDATALLLSLLISIPTMAGIAIYILFSRLYSYRGIRLKQYPVIGFLTVILNQGGLIFYLVYQAAITQQHSVPWAGILTSILLIGGFYPITQVYQHQADKKDGVTTISILLGIKGTFLFCMGLYALAFVSMFFYITSFTSIASFITIQLFFLPVLVYFFYWMNLVWKDATQASFKHTMKMNWIASTCTNAAFIYILIQQQLG